MLTNIDWWYTAGFWFSTLLSGLFGAVVGALITAKASANIVREQEERNAQQRAAEEERCNKAVRSLLHIEIDENLSLFRAYWDNIKPPDASDPKKTLFRGPMKGPEPTEVRLATMPPPFFSRRAWEHQLPAIPRALTREETEEVARIYSVLDTFEAMQRQLSNDYSQWKQTQQSDPRTMFRLWTICDDIASRLLSKENPLNKAKE